MYNVGVQVALPWCLAASSARGDTRAPARRHRQARKQRGSCVAPMDRSDWCKRDRVSSLAKQVDPNLELDVDAQQVLQDLAEDFVENVAAFACELVKHREGDTLEVKDLQLAIEKNWNMRLPGIGDNELRVIKKSSTTEAHRHRSQLVRRSQTR